MTLTRTDQDVQLEAQRLRQALRTWTAATQMLSLRLNLALPDGPLDPVRYPHRATPATRRDIDALNAGRRQIAILNDRLTQLSYERGEKL
jgi:hypothetical protein